MPPAEAPDGVGELRSGEVVRGKYRLDRLLGQGGFGVVWKARQIAVGRDVAIKFLASEDPQAAQRFEREAVALGRLRHPNLVAIHDFELGPPAFLVAEFAPGVSAHEWVEGSPSEAQVVQVMAQVSAAIAAGHAAGVVHRDIKPANILIDDQGEELSVKVLDFGLAKVHGSRQGDITKTGEVWGTVGYMSPEQLRGREIDEATDSYCLGVVLYELLSGRPLFSGESKLEISMKHLTDLPPEAPTTSSELRDLVSGLLRKDPATRPTMAEAHETLRRLTDSTRSTSRTPVYVLVTAIVLLCGVAMIVFSDDEEQVAATVGEAPLPTSLVRAVPVDRQPDLGPRAAKPKAEFTGCRGYRQLASGRHVVEQIVGLEQEAILTHIPRDYDPQRPYPVVLVFHDGLQRPEDALHVLDPASNRFGEFVLVFAHDDSMMQQWKLAHSISDALLLVDEAAAEICIDRTRLFALGMGAGGLGAERMLCEYPEVRAVAMTSHRQNQSDPKCEPEHPRPLLFISVTEDPLEPIEGGKDCAGGDKWSLKEHIDWLKTTYGCEGAADVSETDVSLCESWDCEVPLETCLLEGGRPWPGDPRLTNRNPLEFLFACRSDAAPFDYGAKLGEFFWQIDSARE